MSKVLAIAACSLISVSAMAQGPKAKEINISELTARGDGCPAGTTEVLVTPSRPGSKNADYFQVVYDAFEVRNGEGVPRRERTKSCNVTMNVEYPKGYRFKFEHSSFDGYAELEKGLKGQFSTYYRRPNETKVSTKATIRGPFEGDITRETGTRTRGFYTSCDGSDLLTIQANIRIRGDKDLEGKVTKDISSGNLVQRYRLYWERCEEN